MEWCQDTTPSSSLNRHLTKVTHPFIKHPLLSPYTPIWLPFSPFHSSSTITLHSQLSSLSLGSKESTVYPLQSISLSLLSPSLLYLLSSLHSRINHPPSSLRRSSAPQPRRRPDDEPSAKKEEPSPCHLFPPACVGKRVFSSPPSSYCSHISNTHSSPSFLFPKSRRKSVAHRCLSPLPLPVAAAVTIAPINTIIVSALPYSPPLKVGNLSPQT